MPRLTKPLTDTQIKQAKPKNKIYKLSDGGGLQLKLMTNGTKYWVLDYVKPITKVRTTLGLGSYPSLSLANARKLRNEAKTLLAQGIDPKEHKDDGERKLRLEASNTFECSAKSWFDIKAKTIAESTAIGIWRSFENHVFPSIGHRPINKLLAPEVIEVLKPLEAKGSLVLTRKIIGHINQVMTRAVNLGLLGANPLAKISCEFEAPKTEHMLTIKPEELPKFMQTLNEANIRVVTRFLIKWQFHTMVRPGEAATAKWSDIDLEEKVWTVPKQNMKMKKLHRIPLTKQSIEILERVRPISGHLEFIFPADRNPKKSTHAETANKAIRNMGYKGILVSHGIRSIASTALYDSGCFNTDHIESALSHVEPNKTKLSYNRTDYLELRKSLMAWWSEFIEQASLGQLPTGISTKNLRLVNS